MINNKIITTVVLNDGLLIKDLSLTLDSRLTVFTGAMGSGKSSILKALADILIEKKHSWVFTNYPFYDIPKTLSFNLDFFTPERSFATYSKREKSVLRLYCTIADKLKCVDADVKVQVLIDDLGDDLHPIWQHKILSSLLKAFPTVQFVVTTTSPLVLTHVQSDSLFFVEKEDGKIKIKQASECYGKTSERILEDLQGLKTTRPIEMEECLQRFYQCLDSSDLANATKELTRAKEMMANASDPALTRMELRLRVMHRNHARDFSCHPDYGLVAELNQRKISLENEINYNYTLGK